MAELRARATRADSCARVDASHEDEQQLELLKKTALIYVGPRHLERGGYHRLQPIPGIINTRPT